ncbi:MAG: hypothetical protein K0S65_1170 [Labilithrix sp.]|nr:hypothetical protein [Labilithrix sp.]
MGVGVKKPRRRREKRLAKPWMSILALMAAESRTDGGVGLQLLLSHARFDERPRLSINKREAA